MLGEGDYNKIIDTARKRRRATAPGSYRTDPSTLMRDGFAVLDSFLLAPV